MKRLIALAATLLMAPVIGATLATTAAASSNGQTIVKPGSFWRVETSTHFCENLSLISGHEFAADEDSDAGTWSEPTHSTIVIKWTAGQHIGSVYKGTFTSASGRYNGHLKFGSGGPSVATQLIHGFHSGC